MSSIGTGIDFFFGFGTSQKPIKLIPTTGHQLSAIDANYVLHFTNDANIKLFVPDNLPLELRYEGKQLGNGVISFVPVSAASIIVRANRVALTNGLNSVFNIDTLNANKFLLYGDLVKPNEPQMQIVQTNVLMLAHAATVPANVEIYYTVLTDETQGGARCHYTYYNNTWTTFIEQ